MIKLEMYEQAMCCETGICGPSFDKELIVISNVFEQFKESDKIEVSRYNLAQSPQAFVDNGTAMDLIRKNGKKILPVVIVDGKVVKTGDYPTLEEFTEYTGVDVTDTEKEKVQ